MELRIKYSGYGEWKWAANIAQAVIFIPTIFECVWGSKSLLTHRNAPKTQDLIVPLKQLLYIMSVRISLLLILVTADCLHVLQIVFDAEFCIAFCCRSRHVFPEMILIADYELFLPCDTDSGDASYTGLSTLT